MEPSIIGNRIVFDFNRMRKTLKKENEHEYKAEKDLFAYLSCYGIKDFELRLAVNHPTVFMQVNSEFKHLRRPWLIVRNNFLGIKDDVNVLRFLAEQNWFHMLAIDFRYLSAPPKELMSTVHLFNLTVLDISFNCENIDRITSEKFSLLEKLTIYNEVMCSHDDCIVTDILAVAAYGYNHVIRLSLYSAINSPQPSNSSSGFQVLCDGE